jgi:hypothetical protein
MWLYYSIVNEDNPMITRSSLEILLLTISAVYIIRNKINEGMKTYFPKDNPNKRRPRKTLEDRIIQLN